MSESNLSNEIRVFLESCDFVTDEDKASIPRISAELDAQIINVSEATDRHMSLAVELSWTASHYAAVAKEAKFRFSRNEALKKLSVRKESERRKQEGGKGTAVPEWVADAVTMSDSDYEELHAEMITTERLASFLNELQFTLSQRARLLDNMARERDRVLNAGNDY
jgi:hypothetical protein